MISRIVLIAGGTGLVGMRLSHLLAQKGYVVRHLSRRADEKATYPTFAWDVDKGTIDLRALEGATALINLAGAGIADKRWTAERRRLIIESRVKSTQLLQQATQQMASPPAVYISAAAIGYYGHQPDDRWQHETDTPLDNGFLVESCQAWEAAIQTVATATSMRTVWWRIGIVLSTKGGALPQMHQPVRWRVAPYFGNGQQYYSWIHIDDLCELVIFSIENPNLSGVYNAVAPTPVTNREFMRTLVKAHGKWALPIPVPAFALRTAMGEMADVVLNSNRVAPDKVMAAGYSFRYPHLLPALQHVLQNGV